MHGLAFAPRRTWTWVKGLVAVVRYPATFLMLAGRHFTHALYTTGHDELVIIGRRTPTRTLLFSGYSLGVLSLGVGFIFAFTGSLLGFAIFAALAIVVVIPDAIAVAILASNKEIRRGLHEQGAAMREENGHEVLGAARAWKGQEGTIERIASFIEAQPELHPCYAVAMTESLALRYSEFMTPIGESGRAFKASKPAPDGHHHNSGDGHAR